MPLDDRVRLQHMLEWGQIALNLVAGKTKDELEADFVLYLALLRALEVVGEAASQVSPVGRSALPALPWRNIVGMRNRLIHIYFSVNLEVVWSTAVDDLPPLLLEVEKHLASSGFQQQHEEE